jgi:hypothetical protein
MPMAEKLLHLRFKNTGNEKEKHDYCLFLKPPPAPYVMCFQPDAGHAQG